MSEYLLNQWYMAPVWAVNAWALYKFACANYRDVKKNATCSLYAIGFSIGSICSAGMAVVCANKGLEQLLG
ncbi:hypothetical protein KY312_00980 [Candidatus Woesearchaeota archaeon]|nr:hypothetical protein [Candidatus Woesearchaeota archaeon]